MDWHAMNQDWSVVPWLVAGAALGIWLARRHTR